MRTRLSVAAVEQRLHTGRKVLEHMRRLAPLDKSPEFDIAIAVQVAEMFQSYTGIHMCVRECGGGWDIYLVKDWTKDGCLQDIKIYHCTTSKEVLNYFDEVWDEFVTSELHQGVERTGL